MRQLAENSKLLSQTHLPTRIELFQNLGEKGGVGPSVLEDAVAAKHQGLIDGSSSGSSKCRSSPRACAVAAGCTGCGTSPARFPKSRWHEIKPYLVMIRDAPDLEAGQKAVREFPAKFSKEFPGLCKCLTVPQTRIRCGKVAGHQHHLHRISSAQNALRRTRTGWRSPNAQETTFTAWLFAGLSGLDQLHIAACDSHSQLHFEPPKLTNETGFSETNRPTLGHIKTDKRAQRQNVLWFVQRSTDNSGLRKGGAVDSATG